MTVRRFALTLLLALGLSYAAPRPAEAQDGPATQAQARSAARVSRAQLRAASRGTGPEATRARAQRVNAVLGRANAARSGALRRYVRGGGLSREVSHLAEAHDAHHAAAESASPVERQTASRLLSIARRARRIDPAALDEGAIDRVEGAVARTRYRARVGSHESAVEIEAYMNGEILDAMGTEDGTVGPILREGGQPAPDFIREMAGEGGNVESVSFDALDRDQRIDLLRSQSRGRRFFSNRRIPGIVFRDEVSNQLEDGTPRVAIVRLRGQPQSGPTANVRGVLMRHVEYMGPTSVEDVDGVEIHVRQTGPAARNLRDAVTVENLLNIGDAGRHQHVTARVPAAVRRGNAVDRMHFVDFYRRVNMVAELDTILQNYPLMAVTSGGATYFDYLRSSGLRTLNNYLRSLRTGRGYMGNSTLKMAAVGFRPGELYSNHDLVGFEVRTLSTDGEPPQSYFQLVDAVQRGLVGRNYGVPRTRMARWYQANVGEGDASTLESRENTAIESLHYNRDIDTMMNEASATMEITGTARERILESGQRNYGVKLLLHDFSRDPAFEGQVGALERVQQAQRAAIEAMGNNEQVGDVLTRFVRHADLYGVYARSLGME